MTKTNLQELFAKRIVKLSKQRKIARKKLNSPEVDYINGRIDELRYTLNEINEILKGIEIDS